MNLYPETCNTCAGLNEDGICEAVYCPLTFNDDSALQEKFDAQEADETRRYLNAVENGKA